MVKKVAVAVPEIGEQISFKGEFASRMFDNWQAGLSETVTMDAAKAYAKSTYEKGWESLKDRLPAFAVGADVIPNDMLAMVHEGEQIVPKAFNPNLPSNKKEDNSGLQREILAELRSLSEATLAGSVNSAKLTRILTRVSPDGDSLAVTII